MVKIFYSLICFLMLLFSDIRAQFDYDSYRNCSLDSLVACAPKAVNYLDSSNTTHHNNYAYDVITPEKLTFEVTLSEYPKVLDTLINRKANIYEKFLSSLGFNNVPSINHYISIKSKTGKQWKLLIQDALVGDLLDEVKIGDKFTLYCLYFYNDKKGPGLLINDFQAGE